ncbi:MAG: TraM recognition domain-containing protein, partial [Candidatus Falkowbacteria bacterium]
MDYSFEQPNSSLINTANLNIDTWLIFLLWIIALIICMLLIRKLIKYLVKKNYLSGQSLFMVRLPKEVLNEQKNEETVQKLHEDIAKGETIFSSIGGLKAKKGFLAWIMGRQDHFSFEIAAINKKICFYYYVPKKLSRYLEQQINAHYPEAVIEEAEDYNIFSPYGQTVAGFLKTRRSFVLPIKTYQKMEIDPMNSILNVMSKLDNNEGMVIQYLVRSAPASWHRKAHQVAREINQGKNVAEALKTGVFYKILNQITELFKAAKPPSELEKQKKLGPPRKLSAMEEEMLKGIEEKNSKAGLDVNIRVVVNSKNSGQAGIYLENIASAFSQYSFYEYGNRFNNKVNRSKQKSLLEDFIYRRFDEKIKFLLNTEELASLFHFPLSHTETPNILWLTARFASAPTNLPEEGIILGENEYRGINKEIKIKRDDRRRHTYIIGKSGVGKSVMLASMAIQDIVNGEGVCVLDPHGDLINDILGRIPAERAEDVILFSPADIERPMALNLLEFDPKYPEQKTFVINEMIKIFDKLYDLKQTGGPIFEQYIRNAMLLVMSDPDSGSTLMEIPKVLADADFRRLKLERCRDITVVDFWRKEAEKAGGDAALANVVPYVTSKLTSFISNDMMRPIIGQQKSSFNLREIMDRQKILLVDLSKGSVGEMNAHLLGMIIVGKILMSALSRTDIPREQRKDFYLYIDEFQNFTTDSICSILSEARKYNLNLIIAHQYLGQLVKNQDTSIKEAVFGNAGTWVVFKIGSEDA